MISVEEAAERILAQVSVLEAERRPPLDALGQVLAEDVRAAFSIPPHDNSAMDGYAVLAGDTAGARPDAPRFLRVVGELHAGHAPEVAVEPGTAVRIMTGAPMPPGADAVVQFEHTTEASADAASAGFVGVLRPARPGGNIRRVGEDIREGETVLAAGTEVRPAEVGVLASLGLTSVAVVRRPRVAILSTGDEIAAPGEALAPGKIYDANSYSVAALVRRYGGVATLLGIASDHADDLVARIRAGLDADLLITSAGVSVGDYDLVKRVLAAEGKIGFWQVRMKPGRPLAFGQIRGVPVVGLPGNPVASMIAFEQFVRPAIRKMLGKRCLKKPEVVARLVGSADNRDGRLCFVRARVVREGDGYVATVTGPQGSGILTSMSLANGLVLIPEDEPKVTTGDRVRVQMLDWPEVE